MDLKVISLMNRSKTLHSLTPLIKRCTFGYHQIEMMPGGL
jgi:hypothetical protein